MLNQNHKIIQHKCNTQVSLYQLLFKNLAYTEYRFKCNSDKQSSVTGCVSLNVQMIVCIVLLKNTSYDFN